MKYVTPEIEIIAITADAAMANDHEIDQNFGDMISKDINP